MFGRRQAEQEIERYTRSDLGASFISEVINYVAAARADGLPVEPDQLPIAVGAATLHADTVAAMPARTDQPRAVPRVLNFLERPDPDTDYRAFIHACVLAMFWHGYAPIALDRPAGGTSSARCLDPTQTIYDPSTDRWWYNGEQLDSRLVYPLSLMNDPRRGPLGESPLRRCYQALSMYGYAYRYLIDYFAQGGNPSSILKTTHPVKGDRATELVTEWITARQQRRPAVMDPTITLEVPQASGELAATLSVLDHGAAEVARLLNMPGSLVNAPSLGSSLNYSNTVDELRRWIALSLKPTWMARIESMMRTLTGDPTVYLDPSELLAIYADLTVTSVGDTTRNESLNA